MTSRYIDTIRAAEYLGISVSSIKGLKRRGNIPCSQPGRGCHVIYDVIELDKWVANNKLKTRQELNREI